MNTRDLRFAMLIVASACDALSLRLAMLIVAYGVAWGLTAFIQGVFSSGH